VAKWLDGSRCDLAWKYVSAQATLCQMGTQLPLLQRGTAPQFSAHICCSQMAGWIKMPLGREVGLSPSDIVSDKDAAPLPQKVVEPPNFWPMSIVAKRLDG